MEDGRSDLRQDVRLDKWLWAARFFKMRSLATEAVKGGHVQVNGERGKASKSVRIGDSIVIVKGSERFAVMVTGLAEKRGAACVARALYEESADSIAERAKQAELHRYKAALTPAPEKRPDKRARRQLKRIKEERG